MKLDKEGIRLYLYYKTLSEHLFDPVEGEDLSPIATWSKDQLQQYATKLRTAYIQSKRCYEARIRFRDTYVPEERRDAKHEEAIKAAGQRRDGYHALLVSLASALAELQTTREIADGKTYEAGDANQNGNPETVRKDARKRDRSRKKKKGLKKRKEKEEGNATSISDRDLDDALALIKKESLDAETLREDIEGELDALADALVKAQGTEGITDEELMVILPKVRLYVKEKMVAFITTLHISRLPDDMEVGEFISDTLIDLRRPEGEQEPRTETAHTAMTIVDQNVSLAGWKWGWTKADFLAVVALKLTQRLYESYTLMSIYFDQDFLLAWLAIRDFPGSAEDEARTILKCRGLYSPDIVHDPCFTLVVLPLVVANLPVERNQVSLTRSRYLRLFEAGWKSRCANRSKTMVYLHARAAYLAAGGELDLKDAILHPARFLHKITSTTLPQTSQRYRSITLLSNKTPCFDLTIGDQPEPNMKSVSLVRFNRALDLVAKVVDMAQILVYMVMKRMPQPDLGIPPDWCDEAVFYGMMERQAERWFESKDLRLNIYFADPHWVPEKDIGAATPLA